MQYIYNVSKICYVCVHLDDMFQLSYFDYWFRLNRRLRFSSDVDNVRLTNVCIIIIITIVVVVVVRIQNGNHAAIHIKMGMCFRKRISDRYRYWGKARAHWRRKSVFLFPAVLGRSEYDDVAKCRKETTHSLTYTTNWRTQAAKTARGNCRARIGRCARLYIILTIYSRC